jgi:hypothetical protein
MLLPRRLQLLRLPLLLLLLLPQCHELGLDRLLVVVHAAARTLVCLARRWLLHTFHCDSALLLLRCRPGADVALPGRRLLDRPRGHTGLEAAGGLRGCAASRSGRGSAPQPFPARAGERDGQDRQAASLHAGQEALHSCGALPAGWCLGKGGAVDRAASRCGTSVSSRQGQEIPSHLVEGCAERRSRVRHPKPAPNCPPSSPHNAPVGELGWSPGTGLSRGRLPHAHGATEASQGHRCRWRGISASRAGAGDGGVARGKSVGPICHRIGAVLRRLLRLLLLLLLPPRRQGQRPAVRRRRRAPGAGRAVRGGPWRREGRAPGRGVQLVVDGQDPAATPGCGLVPGGEEGRGSQRRRAVRWRAWRSGGLCGGAQAGAPPPQRGSCLWRARGLPTAMLLDDAAPRSRRPLAARSQRSSLGARRCRPPAGAAVRRRAARLLRTQMPKMRDA